MKTKKQPTQKKERTFTVIVEPKFYEVDCPKEGTFTFPAETLEDVSWEELNQHFHQIVSNTFKSKGSLETFMWFEN